MKYVVYPVVMLFNALFACAMYGVVLIWSFSHEEASEMFHHQMKYVYCFMKDL